MGCPDSASWQTPCEVLFKQPILTVYLPLQADLYTVDYLCKILYIKNVSGLAIVMEVASK